MDRQQRIDLAYRLTFHAPFHCGTGRGLGLLDRTVQRDPVGRLRIPGSTIKGTLREACERTLALVAASVPQSVGDTAPALRADSPHDNRAALRDLHPRRTVLARIFGSRACPGALYFEDAALSEEWRRWLDSDAVRGDVDRYRFWQVEERTQVSVARLTGTARAGHLFASEYGRPYLDFEGRVYGVLEDGTWWDVADGESVALALLLASLRRVDSLGGGRSSGFGRCSCTVTALSVDGQLDVDPAAYLRHLTPATLGEYARRGGHS